MGYDMRAYKEAEPIGGANPLGRRTEATMIHAKERASRSSGSSPAGTRRGGSDDPSHGTTATRSVTSALIPTAPTTRADDENEWRVKRCIRNW